MEHKLNISIVTSVIIIAILVASLGLDNYTAKASSSMIYPIIGRSTYTDDYLGARFNGFHHATDIFAKKGTPIVSSTDGTIVYAPYPQPSWGYMVSIRSTSNWEYNYLHLNNDTPGTDDGKGGAMHAYAPGIRAGEKVKKGQLLGWVGDSGNAETTPPHLHYERYKPDGKPTNPYWPLRTMTKITRPVAAPRQADETLPNGNRQDGLNIALGNVIGDGSMETVIGVGKKPWVHVYEGVGVRNIKFLAYSDSYRGGVDVATGDVDNDGLDEIITTTGGAGMPRVRVFEVDGTMIKQFNAYESTMRSGMTVSTGDIDGDGTADIIVGPRPGGGSTVKAFKFDGTQIASFLTGSVNYRGGVDVAAIDIDGDGIDEIVTGYLKTTGPSVKVFKADGSVVRKIMPFSAKYSGGLKVDTGVFDGKKVIVTMPSTDYVPLVKMYDATTGSRINSKYYLEEWWKGSYDLSIAEDGSIKAATGHNRRDSVRPVYM